MEKFGLVLGIVAATTSMVAFVECAAAGQGAAAAVMAGCALLNAYWARDYWRRVMPS